MNSIIDSTSRNALALLALIHQVQRDVSGTAGKGDLAVLGVAKTTSHTLDLIDPETGKDVQVNVEWRSALDIETRLKRPRPYGYLLPASETVAADRLRLLGVAVFRLATDSTLNAERYRITVAEESKKDDVRRNDDEGTVSVVRFATATEPGPSPPTPATFTYRSTSPWRTSSPPRWSRIRKAATPPIAC